MVSFTYENIILIGSILLFASILASRTTRYGIPVLVLFLAIGMLAGSDGPGGIHFNDPQLAKFIGAVALSIILFSGGLETKMSDIRPVLWQGVTLSTIGVAITAMVVGVAVWLFSGFSLLEGLLLGAIVSSTDAAAVFSILRSKALGLKGRLRPLLELESGSNDPMAYFLTILFIFLIQNPDASAWSLVQLFFRQMLLGVAIGYFMGIWMKKILNWIQLEYEGLYSVLLLTLVFFTFSFTEYAGGNALLAIYIAGVFLGNSDFVHKKSLTKHFDGQAWLMQIIMFITLGLLVFPSDIVPFIGTGMIIAAILILLARPVSIFLCLMFFKFSNRKKLLISWVGLRGAVPIILATYPLTAGIDKSHEIFNIVFFVALTSVLIQGTTLGFVSRILKLSVPENLKKQSALDIDLKWKVKSILLKVPVKAENSCSGKAIVSLGLPNSIIITMIERNNSYFISDGATVLQPNDILYVLADNEEAVAQLNACLGIAENKI